MKVFGAKLYFTSFLVIVFISVTPFLHAQTQWTKYAGNPILTKGPDNFDILAIGQPAVLFENDTIKMWYGGVGNDWKSRICYAWSTDGINWTKHSQPVLDVGGPGEWDRGWVDTPEIIKDSSGYKMLYYGDTAWQFSAINSSIGLAYSSDGINWTKEATNPVFFKGNPGEWDGSWVESPALYRDNITGEYMMWYNGVDTSTWKIQIGLATSVDAVNWIRHPSNPLLTNSNWGGYDDMWLGTPAVLFIGNKFELWYSSTAAASYNGSTSSFDTINICLATSPDGINWTKHVSNPLFHTYTSPYSANIDQGGPWAPDVIFNPSSQTYMMFYEAEGGVADYTISLATAPRDTLSISSSLSCNGVKVFPNPFTNTATVCLTRPVNDAVISLFDNVGKKVRHQNHFSGTSFEIVRDDLKSGLYFLTIEENGNVPGRIKIIIK